MNIGDIITVTDLINYDIHYTATIRMIEVDDEINGLIWLYLRANEENLNTEIDPRIGTYWCVLPANSERIIMTRPASF